MSEKWQCRQCGQSKPLCAVSGCKPPWGKVAEPEKLESEKPEPIKNGWYFTSDDKHWPHEGQKILVTDDLDSAGVSRIAGKGGHLKDIDTGQNMLFYLEEWEYWKPAP